jgi:hypothetical protein
MVSFNSLHGRGKVLIIKYVYYAKNIKTCNVITVNDNIYC